jgi:hypothetical protein
MFCPNCASKIEIEQKFCRSCGLKLDAVVQVVSEQIPTREHAKLQKRKELFEKLGIFSLSAFALIGFAFIISVVGYYKIILFGADVIFWCAFAAFAVFGLLTVFFFNYPKLFLKLETVNLRLSKPEEGQISNSTNKLLPDGFIEPIPSVTENSTELFPVENKTRKLE